MGYYVHHFIPYSNRKLDNYLVTFSDRANVDVENKILAHQKTEKLIKIAIYVRKLG